MVAGHESGRPQGEQLIGRRIGHHGAAAADEPRHRAVGEGYKQFDDEQRREQPRGASSRRHFLTF